LCSTNFAGNHAFPVTAIVINLQDVSDNCATHLWCAVRDGPQKKRKQQKNEGQKSSLKIMQKMWEIPVM